MPRLLGPRRDVVGLRIAGGAQPVAQQAQRVVPQRVDLDRLAAARGHDPVADLGVHPGQLIALLALGQEAVLRIDPDAEFAALDVMTHDVAQDRKHLRQCRLVRNAREIARQRVEEPHRRVGGMVETLGIAFREHVRDQPALHVIGEGAQDPLGFPVPSGDQGQPLERDHRVAAPVGEPVVAGDDGAHLVALGMGARDVGDPADRGDDERIGREHEFAAEPVADFRLGHRDQPPPPLDLEPARLIRGQRRHRVPVLGAGDQRHGAVRPQFGREIARAPHPAMRLVAALGLGSVQMLVPLAAIGGERAALATGHDHAQESADPGLDRLRNAVPARSADSCRPAACRRRLRAGES